MKIKTFLFLLCFTFTFLTVLSSFVALLQGQEHDTHIHIISRFFVTLIGIGSFYLFMFLKKIMKNSCFLIVTSVHYMITMSFIFIFIWVQGKFLELHPNAYRDIFWNFSLVYLGIASIYYLYEKYKMKKISNK